MELQINVDLNLYRTKLYRCPKRPQYVTISKIRLRNKKKQHFFPYDFTLLL